MFCGALEFQPDAGGFYSARFTWVALGSNETVKRLAAFEFQHRQICARTIGPGIIAPLTVAVVAFALYTVLTLLMLGIINVPLPRR